jgi:hypothetical protein
MKPRRRSTSNELKAAGPARAGGIGIAHAIAMLNRLREERRELRKAILHLQRIQILRGERPRRPGSSALTRPPL